MSQNVRQEHKGGAPSIYGQQDASSSARDNIGQNIKDTRLIPGKINKIPVPVGNRTLGTGLQRKDSIDHAMVTDATM